MKKHMSFPTLITGVIIWCTLQGNFLYTTVFEAIFFSSVAAVIQARIFYVNKGKKERLNLSPIKIISYFFLLIFEIYKASFKMIIYIIKGKEDVKVVKIPTKIENHWQRVIIATSITLTPGTITITEQRKILWVIGLDMKGNNKEEVADKVKGSFENLLIDRRMVDD